MRRLSRDPGSLLAFLAALDQASLAARRAPSIPLARQVLADLSGAGLLHPH